MRVITRLTYGPKSDGETYSAKRENFKFLLVINSGHSKTMSALKESNSCVKGHYDKHLMPKIEEFQNHLRLHRSA